MPNETLSQSTRKFLFHAALLAVFVMPHPATAQIPKKPTPRLFTSGGEATLEADQQRESGKIFYADGHVEVRYENARLRADHVEYDSASQIVSAHGHVQLDYRTQHVEADDARYELRTGRGAFHNARGTFALQRQI